MSLGLLLFVRPQMQQVQLGLMQQRQQRKERKAKFIAEAFLWISAGDGERSEKKTVCQYMSLWKQHDLLGFTAAI